MNRFGVILTHNRPDLLVESVGALRPQVDHLLVVDNASKPPVRGIVERFGVWLMSVPDQPPNLSRLWARGLGWARSGDDAGAPTCHVAFLCDDAIAPPGWFDAVSAAMAETGAAAGSSNPWGYAQPPMLKTGPDYDLINRMPGWAFVLDARKPVDPDPRFRWWWGDTDLDWQARAAGGMVMIGGLAVPNLRPNDFTATVPGLAERCGLDRLEFQAKWGACPW